MNEQKQKIIEFIQMQKSQGHKVTEILKNLGIKHSTYYSWLKPRKKAESKKRLMALTPQDKKAIDDAKEEYPYYRHHRYRESATDKGFVFISQFCIRAFKEPR